jgi:hypothetical protein
MATHGSQAKVCRPIARRRARAPAPAEPGPAVEAISRQVAAAYGQDVAVQRDRPDLVHRHGVQRGAAWRRGMVERAATEELTAFGRRLV